MTTLRDFESKHMDIDLLINSGGGEMFEGLPLYNNLCLSPVNVTADIQGLAASMITIVMCGAKKVRAASNSKIMVHGPRGGDYTNIEGLENLVTLMKSMREDMAKVYAKKTGKTEQWIMDNWLSDGKDHWFTAQEAKAVGLVDEVYEVKADTASPQASWPLRRIAAFYEERLSLNNSQNKTEPSMKKIIAVLTGSKLVSLPETATEELVAESTQALVNQMGQKDQIIAQKDARIKELEDQQKESATKALKDKSVAMVQGALSAKKIVATQVDNLVKLASASEEGYQSTKEFLDSLKGYESVNAQLYATGGANTESAPKTFPSLKAEFDARSNDGSLETLRAENPDHFNRVYKAGTGKEFKA